MRVDPLRDVVSGAVELENDLRIRDGMVLAVVISIKGGRKGLCVRESRCPGSNLGQELLRNPILNDNFHATFMAPGK